MRSPPVRLARPFRFCPCPCTHPLGCCGLRCLGAKVLFKGKGIHVSNLVVVARMEAVCVDETWRRLAVGVLFLGFVLCDLRMRKRKRRKGRTGWRVFRKEWGLAFGSRPFVPPIARLLPFACVRWRDGRMITEAKEQRARERERENDRKESPIRVVFAFSSVCLICHCRRLYGVNSMCVGVPCETRAIVNVSGQTAPLCPRTACSPRRRAPLPHTSRVGPSLPLASAF